MNLIKQNVGVDVSKGTFDARFVEMYINQDVKYREHRKFKNTSQGIEEFSKWCNKLKCEEVELHITMEATGVYYESLAYRMNKKDNVIVHVVLPNNAKKYFESLNLTVKTDKIDAKYLGLLGIERSLRIFKPMSDIYIKFRKLSREKEQLTDERTMVMNQRHAENYSEFPLKKSITRFNQRIKYLKKQIVLVEKDLRALVDKDEYISAKVKKIETIPGIGFNTIIGVIAETGGFENITSIKQLTSYSGMDVTIKESGQWKGRSKISKKGNSHLRRLMYMPTLSVIRNSSTFKNNYNRINEGKEHKMKGVVAMQRKALGLIYTLWKNDTIYDENYNK